MYKVNFQGKNYSSFAWTLNLMLREGRSAPPVGRLAKGRVLASHWAGSLGQPPSPEHREEETTPGWLGQLGTLKAGSTRAPQGQEACCFCASLQESPRGRKKPRKGWGGNAAVQAFF